MGSLQSCGPCNCSSYGSRKVYNITAQPIQQWLVDANNAGSASGMNPATLLAIASIETDGNYAVVYNGTYGIVQVGQDRLNGYNCLKGTNYKLTDLIAQGPNITEPSAAVAVSFDILGRSLHAVNLATSSFKLAATGWNGAMCGNNGSVQPYGAGCGSWPIPTATTCYGVAAYQLASAYSGWWNNPSTGQPDSYYWGGLSPVPYDTLPTYIQVCFGP
ncbi:hypothetical protein [Desulfotomaculum copahuensis]|uniref:hypothetical protein n=1 Tax=Desulfotomaculum copahuensis TaxID=1838280 RepID=UPI000B0E6325|nr:hypothetical protein [Desulfotomaculum copahuensis]